MIPFVDLKKQYKEIEEELLDKISKVLKNSSFILGKEVEEFENNFAEFCGKKYAVGVNSGTDALFLALKAMDIKKGDEVIVPANTFIATALAVVHSGAKPVFVDIDEKTYNIDPKKIKEKITKNTKVILPVHLYGCPSEMREIARIAEENNIKILEDCCQAHGAEYNNKKLPYSSTGCFSFYPSKNLGAYGDAGIIVTDNKTLYERIKKIRNYGETKKYFYSEKGFNTRLDEFQAAILNVKLKYLENWTEKRRTIAKTYDTLLKGIVKIPCNSSDSKHSYHLYVVRSTRRGELKDYLESRQIYTGIHYPVPIHKQESFKEYNHESYPVTEKISKEIISLPMFPELKIEEVKEVCKKIKEFENENHISQPIINS